MASSPANTLRPPAVAGLFYPTGRAELSRTLAALLDAVAEPELRPPKAIIAPHAGYVYSGPVAAAAYAPLKPLRGRIRRVVLLGPAHRVALRGLAVPATHAFSTPLGDVRIDTSALAALHGLPQVVVSDRAHAGEHSLEVQLPFLQTVLGDFGLLPLVVGDATPEEVAQVLERLWGGEETLVVVSSDLSHYHDYAEAQRLDRETAGAIAGLHIDLDPEQACGAYPVNGLNLVAQRRGLQPVLLDLRNSGDTAGDRSRVVGYAAFAYHEPRH
jgi:AmmeMemoRadiSam system protein B